jgi:hypothetical protein
MDILEYAVLLAKSLNATLIALSVIQVPETRRFRGARLEHVQQSKDFLGAVQHKATKHGVPIERLEVFTSDVAWGIHVLAQQMACEGLLLFVRDREGVLLSAEEVEHFLNKGTFPLYIVHLASKENKKLTEMLLEHLSNWISGRRKQIATTLQMQRVLEEKAVRGNALPSHPDVSDLETTTWH